MDNMNEFVGGGLPYAGYPTGVGPLIAMDELSRENYEKLSETEKEHLILKCKDAKNADDKERIVKSVVPDMSARAVAAEEAEDNSYKNTVK